MLENAVPSRLTRETLFREGTAFSGSTISPRPTIKVNREQHSAPESVRRRLEIAGGRNRFGEANYRAVWGWSRLAWVGGKWEDRNAAGELVRECVELRHVPKYAPHDRWHIERWLPPEAYGSPRAWYAQTVERGDGLAAASIPALGPYPERGGVRALLHAGRFARPIRATHVHGGRLYCLRDRSRPARERGRTAPGHRGTRRERRSASTEVRYNWAWDVLDSGCAAFHGMPFVGVL